MAKRTGIYPGTFDPITLGHMDIVQRAVPHLDHLIIAVAENAGKCPLFSLEERAAMAQAEVDALGLKNVEVKPFSNLLIQFAKDEGATALIRGLRAVSDFEYEFQMAGTNRVMVPEIETLFLMASEKYQLISSRFVKEIARMGGDVSHFVSERVLQVMKAD